MSRNGIVIGSVELQGNGFVAYNISGAVIGKFQFAYGRTPRPADAATMTLTTALMVLALFVVMRGCCGCKNNFRSSFIPAPLSFYRTALARVHGALRTFC